MFFFLLGVPYITVLWGMTSPPIPPTPSVVLPEGKQHTRYHHPSFRRSDTESTGGKNLTKGWSQMEDWEPVQQCVLHSTELAMCSLGYLSWCHSINLSDVIINFCLENQTKRIGKSLDFDFYLFFGCEIISCHAIFLKYCLRMLVLTE